MMDADTPVQSLIDAVDCFRGARNWQQFHTPKNLAISIAIEAAELMEHFQWGEQSPSPALVADELADVLIYCLNFASIYGLDVSTIVHRKMARNAEKYPETSEQLALFAADAAPDVAREGEM